jgi:hypothetical protein
VEGEGAKKSQLKKSQQVEALEGNGTTIYDAGIFNIVSCVEC